MPLYRDTPVFKLKTPETEEFGVTLLVKREDLNHPFISGNKWWKLKYNFAQASNDSHETVLTFGGAYSNHIYATAAYAQEAGFKSIGIIRGEEALPLNPTLQFAREMGMEIHYVTRAEYRSKSEAGFIDSLTKKFGSFYLIPEGGTNELAVKGCAEFAEHHLSKIEFDHLFLPIGTGGTMAGLICGFEGRKSVVGISVLKDGGFLKTDVASLIRNYSGKHYGNWEVLTSYDHGGYAKATENLKRFIVMMSVEHNLRLDHVYTAKMLWAVLKEIESGKYQRGTTILALHTGGLQGALPQ